MFCIYRCFSGKVHGRLVQSMKHSLDGSTHIERVIRTIQELMRFAMMYVLNNPNFPSFGFTKKHIVVIFSFGQSIKSI